MSGAARNCHGIHPEKPREVGDTLDTGGKRFLAFAPRVYVAHTGVK